MVARHLQHERPALLPRLGGPGPAPRARPDGAAAPHRAARHAGRRHRRGDRRPVHRGQSGHRSGLHGPDVRGRRLRQTRHGPAPPGPHRPGHHRRHRRVRGLAAHPAVADDRCDHRHRVLRPGPDRCHPAQPPRGRRGRPAARRADRAAGRDGPQSGRRRRAGPDGPRAARHGGQPPVRHRHPLHGRAVDRLPRDEPGGPRGDPGEQRAGAGRNAPPDRAAAGRGRGPGGGRHAVPRCARRPAGAGPGQRGRERAGLRAPGRPAARGAAAGPGGAGGVPDRPGVADERPQARRPGHGPGPRDARGRAADRTRGIPVRRPAGPPRPGSGAGLVGMRERTELLGGEFSAGRAGSVWLVRAELPAEEKAVAG